MAGVVIASSTMFGWTIWLTWLRSISAYRSLLHANQASLDHLMPTMIASLHQVGASQVTGYAIQGLLATVLAACVWRQAARAIDDRTIAVSILATILVTPYAFTYDMPMVAACFAIEWQRRKKNAEPVEFREAIAVLSVFPAIMVMSVANLPFVVPVLLTVIFAMTLSRRRPYSEITTPTAVSG